MHEQHYFHKQQTEMHHVLYGYAHAFACKQKGTAHNYGYHHTVKRHSEAAHKEVGYISEYRIEKSAAKSKNYKRRRHCYGNGANYFLGIIIFGNFYFAHMTTPPNSSLSRRPACRTARHRARNGKRCGRLRAALVRTAANPLREGIPLLPSFPSAQSAFPV